MRLSNEKGKSRDECLLIYPLIELTRLYNWKWFLNAIGLINVTSNSKFSAGMGHVISLYGKREYMYSFKAR